MLDWRLVGYVALIVWVMGMSVFAGETMAEAETVVERVVNFFVLSGVFLGFGGLVGLVIFG